MCGFTGYVNNAVKDVEVIKNMSALIAHRGPDSEGYYIDEDIHLAFRRLKIIDLNNGDQPIYNETNDKIIVFNGEIYNYLSLRESLEEKGHTFKTNTDTEVILHGYEEYGEKVLNKLRGMFAFVIWDKQKKELFAARDFFGIKPFYYAFMNDTFFFTSEIKSLLCNPFFDKKLNKEALKTYLTFQYNPMDETFFKGVFKLKPGHFIKYSEGNLKIKKYFQINFKPSKTNNEYTIYKKIQSRIIDSVGYHRIADVNVGSFLSGGIDSSYITSILKPNLTFTVGFEDDSFNETSDAKNLSDILKIKNINKIITPDEFFSAVPDVQYFSDEPHANLSAVPLYFLSKLAKPYVTVVLSGEGADELFGGYAEYSESNLIVNLRLLPKCVRKFIKKVALKLPDIKGKNFLLKIGSDIKDYYIGQAYIFNEKEANDILTKEYKTNIKPSDVTYPFFKDVEGLDDITRKQYVDMNLWLPNDILLKADKMTMANSLELRVPFLDKEVLNVALKLGEDYKIRNNTHKYALRKSALDLLPTEWKQRNKKGFLVPFKEYLKDEKYYSIVKREFQSDYASIFFDKEKILNLLEMHYNGVKETHRKIYTIYSFLIWYKQYFINI